MAELWFKMDANLLHDPRVLRMAEYFTKTQAYRTWVRNQEPPLGPAKHHAVAGLLVVWASFRNEKETVSTDLVDEAAGFGGFANAMISARWLEQDPTGRVRFVDPVEGPMDPADKQKAYRERKKSGPPQPLLFPEEALLSFPCVAKQTGQFAGLDHWSLAPDQLYVWKSAYTVDVMSELRKAQQWLAANPGKKKTYSGMPRFLVMWLNRAQDGQRGGGAASPLPPRSNGAVDTARRSVQAQIEEERRGGVS